MRTILASLVPWLAAPVAAQTTWFVDASGAPPGTGTALDPYTSIQVAHDNASTHDGDELRCAPGTYAENVLLSKRVLLRGEQGALATTLRGATAGTVLQLGTIASDPADAPTVSGFTITGFVGAPAFTLGVVSSFAGVLADCVVLGTHGEDGVVARYDVRVVSSTIAGCGNGVRLIAFSTATLHESIVWGNANDVAAQGGTIDVRYCAGFAQGFPANTGPGNVPGDPMTWDFAGGDFHLRPGSPCIDAGDPLSVHDADGSRADIGAFAYDPAYAPAPVVYCEGKLNSQGCVPAIAASGVASASSGLPFTISATNVVPHRRGLLFYGFGPDAVPFQGGTYCIQQPTRRTRGLDSLGGPAPCTGTYSFDFNARIATGADPGLVPGALVYAQYWYRDPADPFQVGLSDAVRFGIAP